MRGNSITKFVPIIVLLFLVFLRFWKSVEWFSFNFDEEYQALLAWQQVKDFHPIWIGVSAGNFGFYLGPAFTYLNALLLWVSKGDLSLLAYFSSLFGVVTTISIFYVASRIFSKKVGLVSAIIYGFSALIIYFDHRFWNPTPIAFVTVWLMYSLYRAQKDTRWFILSAILMAASLHVHLSLMVFWPIVIYRLIREIKRIPILVWFTSIAAYIAIVFPLIVFDINHNFDNLLSPVNYLLSPKISGGALETNYLAIRLHSIWASLGRILIIKLFSSIQAEHGFGVYGVLSQPHFVFSLISASALLWHYVKSLKEKHISILTVMITSILIFYLIYPGTALEYYLLSFFALMTIILAQFLENIPWKFLAPILGVFVLYNSVTILTTNQSIYGLSVKKALINKVMLQINGRPFLLEAVSASYPNYQGNGGWRYLFQAYGKTPVSSSADEYFGWIYGGGGESKPIYKVVVTMENGLLCEQGCTQISSGAYSAYVYKLN